MFYGTFTNRKRKDCIHLHEDFINLENKRKIYMSTIDGKHQFFPEVSYLNELTHEE